MNDRTWKITSLRDGKPAATVEGVSHTHALVAIRGAMDGRELRLDAVAEQPVEVAQAA